MVFDGLEDLANRIDDPGLDVTADDILVLKNAGSLTPAGMPEAGYLPIPSRLARAGVKDMVRMSDCRMSGTAFGTIVLHITPEAAAGGPLGPGGKRRPDQAVGEGPLAGSAGSGGRTGTAAGILGAAGQAEARLGPADRRSGAAGGRGLRSGGAAGRGDDVVRSAPNPEPGVAA